MKPLKIGDDIHTELNQLGSQKKVQVKGKVKKVEENFPGKIDYTVTEGKIVNDFKTRTVK